MGNAVSCFDPDKNKPTPYSWPPDSPPSQKKPSFDERKRSKGGRKIVGVGGSAHTVERPSADPLPTTAPPVTTLNKVEEEKPLIESTPLETPPVVDDVPNLPPATVPEDAQRQLPLESDPNIVHVMTPEEETKVDQILDDLKTSDDPVVSDLSPDRALADADVVTEEVVVAEVTVKDAAVANGLGVDRNGHADPIVEVEQIEVVTATIVTDNSDVKHEPTPEVGDISNSEHAVDSQDVNDVATPDLIEMVEKNETILVTEVEDIDPVSGAPLPTSTITNHGASKDEDAEHPTTVVEDASKSSSGVLEPSDIPPVDVSELSSIDTRRAIFDRAEDRLPEVREIRRDVLDPVTNELISLEEYRQRQMERAQGVVRERVEKFEGIDEERSRQLAEHNAIEAARTEAIVKATWTFKRRKGNESTPEKSSHATDFSFSSPSPPAPSSEEAALEPVGLETIDDIDEPVAVKEHLGDMLPAKEHREEETSIPERMRSINAYSFDDHVESPKELEEPRPV